MDSGPAGPGKEKVRIRGLARIAGWIFVVWGSVVGFVGLYHAFFGEPEANYYSLTKWEFVTQEQWLRWSGFEAAYGVACIGLGLLAWEYAKRLPEWIWRDKEPASDIF